MPSTYLGAIYATGEGVPQNYKTAVKWFKLAAEQGDDQCPATFWVRMYANGTRVPHETIRLR